MIKNAGSQLRKNTQTNKHNITPESKREMVAVCVRIRGGWEEAAEQKKLAAKQAIYGIERARACCGP